MRKSLLICLTAAFLFSLHGAGFAQDEELERPKKPVKSKIEKIRFGFVGGGVSRGSSSVYGEFKPGCWTPVYVDVVVGSDDLPNGRIVIEGIDSDDVKFSYTVPLPHLKPPMSYLATGYTKPSAFDTEVTITLYSGNQRIAERKENPNALDVGHFLYLTLGARTPGLVRSLLPKDRPPPNQDQEFADAKDTKGRFVGYLDDPNQLPRRWFGYDSADVVLLLTGDVNFVTALLNDRQQNQDASAYYALAEWVRRGGRLMVFAGRNYDILTRLDRQELMLPVLLEGVNTDPEAGSRFSQQVGGASPPAGMHFTQFAPRPGQRAVTDPTLRGDVKQAHWVKGRYGLGEVTVYSFDPELVTFTRSPANAAFWTSFVNRLENEGLKPTMQDYRQGVRFGGYNPDTTGGELGSQLQQTLEDFQDVPVISFGWVALFILLYILIVGPLDYFFLKKVVKRLEFTWITFPVVVLVISAVAYFTAYYVKGNDQRINKVDLVDIDLHGKQAYVYGQSWFTIFSPRIQHYTIGLEPAADVGWAPAEGTSVAVSWLGRPDSTMMGYRRPRSQSLFRRTYEFEPDISGIRGVPIPVWSTKSFVASWAATQPMQGLIEADLDDGGYLISRLPVTLTDAVLIRQRPTQTEILDLETLVPEARRSLANLRSSPRISGLFDFMNRAAQTPPPVKPIPGRPVSSNTTHTMAELLFHDLMEGERSTNRKNSGMRHLDQSWRLKRHGDAILFGRVQRTEQGAEAATKDKSSPSRLWLGKLPKPGETRPALNGTLSQETYVRVFLPARAGREQP